MTGSDPDTARRRFVLLQTLRLIGLAAALAGITLWRTQAFGTTNPDGGRLLFVVGIVLTFLVPALIRRRWRG